MKDYAGSSSLSIPSERIHERDVSVPPIHNGLRHGGASGGRGQLGFASPEAAKTGNQVSALASRVGASAGLSNIGVFAPIYPKETAELSTTAG